MSKILDILKAPWAIDAARLHEIQAIYATHLRGDKIDIGAVEARLGRSLNNESKSYDIISGVAIVNIDGVIAKRMNLFSQISGGCSSQIVGGQLQDAVDDSSVHSIILNIDSPGGTVDGTQALMKQVREAGLSKTVVAFADGLMASAAYWIGSAASEIHISDDLAQIGSIGVIASHRDQSKAEEEMGLKTTLIYAGQYKATGNPHEPLSKDDKQTIQDSVDYTYSIFVRDVADNLGVSVETVLENMADGRVFTGQQAIDAGLVDGVSTLDALIVKLNEDRAGDVQTSNQAKGGQVMSEVDDTKLKAGKIVPLTVDSVKASAPEVAAALIAEGHGLGVKAESERIQAVEAQSMPGHEELIAAMKFDGKTTGPEAAVAVLGAERGALKAAGADHKKDAPKTVAGAVAPEDSGAAGEQGATVEDQAKIDWNKSKALQTEFGGEFASYLAYAKAVDSGSVKVLSGKN